MSRWEFMRKLEELLSDIAPTEREEALQYYNEYFNDAGRENEQEVILALGTPEQVAEIVKEGLRDDRNQGSFTEQGFQNSETVQGELIKHASQPEREEKKGLPTWAIVLLVIATVICSPVIIGVLCSVVGVLFGIFCALFGIILGIGVATLALYIVAIALLVTGFGSLFANPLAGVGMLGAAFICAALGILFMLLFYLLVCKCIPGIFQGIVYICQKLFGKKGGVKA